MYFCSFNKLKVFIERLTMCGEFQKGGEADAKGLGQKRS